MLEYTENPTEKDVSVHVNAKETEFMCFKQEGAISTHRGEHQKLLDKVSNVSSTENEVNIRLAKIYTAIDWLSLIWKYNLSNKKKWNLFQAFVASMLPYGFSTWMLSSALKKIKTGTTQECYEIS